jgi:subtilisin family serine protease
MDYIIRLKAGLTPVPGNPRHDPAILLTLLKSRQTQLQDLLDNIVRELTLPTTDRDRAKASSSMLPGAGVLIVSDEFIDIARLRSREELKVSRDSVLPPMPQTAPKMLRGSAQPWHLANINKPPTLSGAGVTIGVIDTGYDPTLPDLVPPFTAQYAQWQPAQPAQNQPARMQPGLPPQDFDGHGSRVCAFLAGNINGVAPKATIIVAAIKASSMGTTRSQLLLALDWLETKGCDIITTSKLTGNPGATVASSPSLQDIEDDLEEIGTIHDALLTAAIGNIGNLGQFQHPGSSIHSFGVGAVDPSSCLFGSAWGSPAPGLTKPDLVAPGYELEFPTSLTKFCKIGGTSFATPIVAGAAALVIEKFPALRGDPLGIRNKLATLIRPVSGGPPPQSTGAGLLDLTQLH